MALLVVLSAEEENGKRDSRNRGRDGGPMEWFGDGNNNNVGGWWGGGRGDTVYVGMDPVWFWDPYYYPYIQVLAERWQE